jgi:hypothetical protein
VYFRCYVTIVDMNEAGGKAFQAEVGAKGLE